MPAAPAVVYLIQNHRSPEQVALLVRALRRSSPSAFVLVVHDPHAGLASTATVARAVEAPVLATRERARRGYFSLIAPYFEAVEWLAAERVGYGWLVYLSAQDYPTRPLAELEARFAADDADGYLRYWPAFAPVASAGWRRHQGELRYRMQYRELGTWTLRFARRLRFLNGWQRCLHLHLTYGPRLGVRPRHSPFGPSRTCWAGRQWTALSRTAAEYVAERVRAGGELIDWFRATICPDEALVQTLLVGAGRFRLVDEDLHFVDFAGSRDGHPRTLEIDDLGAIEISARPFARKVDLCTAPNLLDALDRRITASSAPARSAGGARLTG